MKTIIMCYVLYHFDIFRTIDTVKKEMNIIHDDDKKKSDDESIQSKPLILIINAETSDLNPSVMCTSKSKNN
jgi:hypothetical protein